MPQGTLEGVVGEKDHVEQEVESRRFQPCRLVGVSCTIVYFSRRPVVELTLSVCCTEVSQSRLIMHEGGVELETIRDSEVGTYPTTGARQATSAMNGSRDCIHKSVVFRAASIPTVQKDGFLPLSRRLRAKRH